MNTSSISARVAVAIAGLVATASVASAAQITYVYSGFASGSIDGNAFDETTFTITATADTANIFAPFPGALRVTHTTATIALTGVGFYTFLTNTSTAVNQIQSLMVFGNVDANLALVRTAADPVFSSYDITSSIGPIPGNGDTLQWGDSTVATSGGTLVLDTAVYQGGTFSAVLVPAPGSLALLGIGGIAVARRRR